MMYSWSACEGSMTGPARRNPPVIMKLISGPRSILAANSGRGAVMNPRSCTSRSNMPQLIKPTSRHLLDQRVAKARDLEHLAYKEVDECQRFWTQHRLHQRIRELQQYRA